MLFTNLECLDFSVLYRSEISGYFCLSLYNSFNAVLDLITSELIQEFLRFLQIFFLAENER